MRKGRLAILSLIAVLIAVMLAGPAGAAGQTYTATLSGAEEVPPRTSTAAGNAEFVVSADGMSMTYKVTLTSEITNLVAGHIHIGKKGENGAVVVNLVPAGQPGNGKKTGVVGEGTINAASLTGPMQGKSFADLIIALDSGDTYVNLHTNDGVDPQNSGAGDFPGGEIRGQISRAPMPGLPSTGAGGSRASLPVSWLVGSAVLGLAVAFALEARRRLSVSR
jgi:hypothetical protein